MSEFTEIQTAIQKARQDREAQRKAAFRFREKLNKLRRDKQQMIRSVGRDSNAYQALRGRERDLRKSVDTFESRLAQALDSERALLDRFEPFTDPRTQLRRLSDDYPVLLFPVRLETRSARLQTIPVERVPTMFLDRHEPYGS